MSRTVAIRRRAVLRSLSDSERSALVRHRLERWALTGASLAALAVLLAAALLG